MPVIRSVCNQLQEMLNYQCCSVSDVSVRLHGSLRQKQQLPAVIVHNTSILVFAEFSECCESKSTELIGGFRSLLNALTERLDVSMNAFLLCGYCKADDEGTSETLCTYNIYTDRINYFLCDSQAEDFVQAVANEIELRRQIFSEEQVTQLAFNFELISGSAGEIRKDSKGNCYLKRHGQWFLASDVDSDDLFFKTVFFGAFGAHKFSEHKRLMGLIYFFSCGGFGIGWFFDCLAILFGMYKDAEGKYLLPVTDRKACLLKLPIGLAITVLYIFIYIFVISTIGDVLNSAVNSSLMQNQSAIPSVID